MKYEQSQLDLSNVRIDETVNNNRQDRSRWRKGMQAHINRQQQSEIASQTGWCACGYMRFCDYCCDSTLNTACVNAIIEMCEKKGMAIDFSRTDYEQQLEEIEKWK